MRVLSALHHVQGTKSYGLIFSKGGILLLHAYNDSDWVGEFDKGQPMSGKCFFVRLMHLREPQAARKG